MKIIKTTYDAITSRYTGFTTEYPDNNYISHTIVYGLKFNDRFDVVEPGHITIVMRNGEKHTFDCMADTVYCSQFGITVSKDGKRVYVISSRVGLWCYSYNGDIQWKTKYTSIGHVIENDDKTITCISSTKILLLDEKGKKIKERKIVPYHAEKASKNIIYTAISENVRALIDCQTLEVVWQTSLKNIGLSTSRYALIYDRYLIINGEKENGRIVFIPIPLMSKVYENSRFDATLIDYYHFEHYFKGMEFKKLFLS